MSRKISICYDGQQCRWSDQIFTVSTRKVSTGSRRLRRLAAGTLLVQWVMGYDDHAEVSTERSANDKWFNIFGIFIARVVTLCFRVNGCAGFFGRIFMFLKYSLKTVMFPYLQKLLAISIEGFIWQMYFFFACPPNLGFFLLLAYFFPIEVFSFNRGPVYHRQILFKGLKPSPAYL